MEDEKLLTQGFSIKDKSCAVIGLGGLGTNVAVHLAGAGIGKMYLCDYDKICKSNLNRQFFYTDEDISKDKCYVLSEKLKKYSPQSDIVSVNKHIYNLYDLNVFSDCDIIFSCVDNNEARIIIEGFCRENNIPLVHGGIDGFYGVAYLYVPSVSLTPSEAGLCQGDKAKYNISSVAGIIGSYQASIGIRYLVSNDDSLSGRILIYDDNKTDTLNLKF